MKTFTPSLLMFLATLYHFSQNTANSNVDFSIDENLELIVNEYILPIPEESSSDSKYVFYDNTIIAEMYQNGELKINVDENDNKSIPFCSVTSGYENDYIIQGMYGLFGGFGFLVKFEDEIPSITFNVVSDETPIYSLNKSNNARMRIQVPTKNAKLTLSKIPDFQNDDYIYGMVEFKSDDYYSKENLPIESTEWNENRIKMKVYFKSKIIKPEYNESFTYE